MSRRIGFITLLLMVVWSCRHDFDAKTYSGVMIKTGKVCGWCTINDTLTIRGNSVRYINYTNCSNKPSVVKTGNLNDAELDELLSKLNFAELEKLSLNTCNVCVDGCDDWILFDNGTGSHYIRFTENSPELQPIQAFVDRLNEIKDRYSKGN